MAEIDPNRGIANAAAMADLGQLMRERRAYVTAVGAFAGVAMLLSMIGVFGIVAHAVGQRTREIGIRKTLGATSREIVALVGRSAMTTVAVGLVAGVGIALWVTRYIASQLWGISATDPLTFVCVVVGLATVALAAAAVPLRRAVRVDPTVALKD
jgi:putative ABC transport system permease protein